jgi:glycosyl transferase, family 25
MTSLPPFWVISLEAAHNRREFVAQGFANVGLGFEKIDAIDGTQLTDEDRHRYSRWRSLFHVGRGLTAGEVGCALSHLEAYRRMVETEIPELVILEDDVQPTRDLLALLGAADSFPSDADVVNFDPLFRSGGPTPVGFPLLDGKYRVCRYRRNPYGAACYRIQLGAARKLLDVGYPVRMTADDLIFRRRPAGIRWYGVEPTAVVRGDLRSELRARSDGGTPPEARVWELPVVLAGKTVHKTRTAWDGVRT